MTANVCLNVAHLAQLLIMKRTNGEEKAARVSKKTFMYFGISIKCVAMQSMLYQLATYILLQLFEDCAMLNSI